MNEQPLSPEAIFQQAMQAHQAGQPQQAISLLEGLLQDLPGNDAVLAALGAIQLSLGNIGAAMPNLEQALTTNPGNIDARVNMGIALQHTGRIEAGLEHLTKAVELAPQRTDIRYNLANTLLQLQQYEPAIDQLQQVISIDPSFLSVYHTLAAVYGYLRQAEQAQQILEQALQAVPADLQTMILLANVLADTGQIKAATEAYQQVVKTHPQQFISHATHGKFLLDIGQLPAGQAALERAEQLNPQDINTHILLGNVHKDLGQQKEAEKYYRQAIAIDPQHEGAIMNLRRILSTRIPFWHFEMLADVDRNDAYESAIKKAIRPDSLVLDIGTGSGLLAMMAARAGAKQVVACEMHEGLAETATEIVALNGYAKTIQVHHKKSTLLSIGEELPAKADVVVSEILDVGGLGEGVLPSIRHASQQLAKPGATLIPSRMKVWGQILEIPSRSKVAPVQEISGFDLSPFEQYRIPNEYTRIVLKAEKYRALSQVFPLMDVDFYNLPAAIPDDQPLRIPLQVPIVQEGMAQAIVFWFDLNVDQDIMVSSRPDGELEHWGQALFCFPNPKAATVGDMLPLIMLQTDHAIRFALP
ncbi:MAG: tetratricopeptide repeat protein [Bacteroidota bacterium]